MITMSVKKYVLFGVSHKVSFSFVFALSLLLDAGYQPGGEMFYIVYQLP